MFNSGIGKEHIMTEEEDNNWNWPRAFGFTVECLFFGFVIFLFYRCTGGPSIG